MSRPQNSNTAARAGARAQADAADRTDAAGTVTVACRLPAGLSVNVAGYGVLEFKGANDRRALALADEQGFHGLTTGVPAEAWNALTEQYADAKWLANGFVFAAKKSKDAAKEARNVGPTDAGFNPVDPATLGVEKKTD